MTEFEIMKKEMEGKENAVVMDNRHTKDEPSIISIFHEDGSQYHAYYNSEGKYIGSLLIAANGKMTMMGVKEK